MVVGLTLGAENAQAGSILYSGNLRFDADVVWFQITLNQGQQFSARTLSFAGGGTYRPEIAPDGFAPVLYLWNSPTAPYFLRTTPETVPPGSPGYLVPDRDTGANWDALASLYLPQGTYYMALAQDPNGPQDGGLPFDPFSKQRGFMSDPIFGEFPGVPGDFRIYLQNQLLLNAGMVGNDVEHDLRTAFWAIEFGGPGDFQVVQVTPVPEPATAMVIGTGLVSLVLLRRRRS